MTDAKDSKTCGYIVFTGSIIYRHTIFILLSFSLYFLLLSFSLSFSLLLSISFVLLVQSISILTIDKPLPFHMPSN